MKKRATGLGHITLLWRRFVRNDQVILTILAVLIGVTVAYGTIGFRELLGAVQNLLYGFSTEDVFSRLGQLTWWHVLLAPAVGGLAVGLALHFLMPGRRNQGIADVIEAGALHGGRMSLNLGIKAFVVNRRRWAPAPRRAARDRWCTWADRLPPMSRAAFISIPRWR